MSIMLQQLIIFLHPVLHLALFTFSKGYCGGWKPPHKKVDQGLCKCHVWPKPLVVNPPPLFSHSVCHAPSCSLPCQPCFSPLVLCTATPCIWHFSFPCVWVQSLLPCLTLVKTFVSRGRKVFFLYSFVKVDVTVLQRNVRPAVSLNVMLFSFRSWLWL